MQSKSLHAAANKLERDAKKLSKRVVYVATTGIDKAQEISRGNEEGAHLFCDVSAACAFHVANSADETAAAADGLHGVQAGSCCLGYEDDDLHGQRTRSPRFLAVDNVADVQSLHGSEESEPYSRSREGLLRIFEFQQADGGPVRGVGVCGEPLSRQARYPGESHGPLGYGGGSGTCCVCVCC